MHFFKTFLMFYGLNSHSQQFVECMCLTNVNQKSKNDYKIRPVF